MTEKTQDAPNINKNIHPPVVAMFYIAIAYLLKWIFPIPYNVPVFLKIIGFGLVVVALIFALSAFIEFRKSRTTLDPHGSVTAIVVNGIYRFTRNPIYLGFLLLIIGISLSANNYWGIIISPLFVIALNRLVIEREEIYLEKKFGREYTNYKSSVRRWL